MHFDISFSAYIPVGSQGWMINDLQEIWTIGPPPHPILINKNYAGLKTALFMVHHKNYKTPQKLSGELIHTTECVQISTNGLVLFPKKISWLEAAYYSRVLNLQGADFLKKVNSICALPRGRKDCQTINSPCIANTSMGPWCEEPGH